MAAIEAAVVCAMLFSQMLKGLPLARAEDESRKNPRIEAVSWPLSTNPVLRPMYTFPIASRIPTKAPDKRARRVSSDRRVSLRSDRACVDVDRSETVIAASVLPLSLAPEMPPLSLWERVGARGTATCGL